MMNTSKKALITGGLGLIGSNLAIKLVREGWKVTIVDALLPLYGGNLFNIESIKNEVELIIGDIRDEKLMRRLVRNKDVIFDFAAQVSYTDSMTDPFLDLDINCRGHLIVLESCRRQGLKPHIFFSSSRMVYGKTQYNSVDEYHPTNPLMIYGVHKLTGEKYYLMYWRDYGIPCTILRIANPYGPRQQMKHCKYGIVNWFIRQAIERKLLTIFGDGEQIRDYIFVEDIAEILVRLAASSKTKGEIFNVGSGIGTSFRAMVETVLKVVGRGSFANIPWPKNYQSIETGDYVFDITKSRSVSSSLKITALHEGIAKTVSYYKKNQKYYW